MTSQELENLIQQVKKTRCETATLEIKSAQHGCPKKLYDTLSSFSNQDDGGIILFGLDEAHEFAAVGVYDAQDLQKQVNAQCLQMHPVVRPVLTVLEQEGRCFVAAEIPGMYYADRPCYYQGRGRLRGSYTRVGDSDEPMTEYEVYAYTSFQRQQQAELRTVARARVKDLAPQKLQVYLQKVRVGKPHLAGLSDMETLQLMGLLQEQNVTLCATLLFAQYPQAFFPQLDITAVVVPGTELGETTDLGKRFLDNERIDGSMEEMLAQAVQFVDRNVRHATIIHTDTGKHEERPDYPLEAVREAVLNAIAHRDYSIYSENIPVQIRMFDDRLEIVNPGGVYGCSSLAELGHARLASRNPVLVRAMEVLGLTENRYSGIPTIRRRMAEYGLPAPEFSVVHDFFTITLRKHALHDVGTEQTASAQLVLDEKQQALLRFCRTPRTRKEICAYLHIATQSYVVKHYLEPLLQQGMLCRTLPHTPKSPRQQYYAVNG